LARILQGRVGLLKIGSRLFTAGGPDAVRRISRIFPRIFLDLKFHDIPNTVAGAVAAAAALPGVAMLTLHAAGGLEMMRAARHALKGRKNAPLLLGVTVLTSLDAASLRRFGIAVRPREWAVKLALLAKQAGFDGVVTSAGEAAEIRRACGKEFLIVVPGVRPMMAAAQDQARVASPSEAIWAGADFLVVGRPITASPHPRAAAERIVEEISGALRCRV
jgi:orotidine-5'-phosphate decarboxylase